MPHKMVGLEKMSDYRDSTVACRIDYTVTKHINPHKFPGISINYIVPPCTMY